MIDAKQVARNLLDRLLAGERGDLPLHLAMLLEKSSPLTAGDEQYHQILPPQLADLRLESNTVREIITILCNRLAAEPDSELIAVVSTTGEVEATRCVVDLLTKPPRPLTEAESHQALGIIYRYLPHTLARNPEFLAGDTKRELLQVLNSLSASENRVISNHAERALKQLASLVSDT